jgi:hypothetical protein
MMLVWAPPDVKPHLLADVYVNPLLLLPPSLHPGLRRARAREDRGVRARGHRLVSAQDALTAAPLPSVLEVR